MIPTFGTSQKAPKIDGKQKQYSGLEDLGIIPATSGPEYFFHEIPGTDRFLTVLSNLG
jgi:hypothetical protein